jgi:hypothetical protein
MEGEVRSPLWGPAMENGSSGRQPREVKCLSDVKSTATIIASMTEVLRALTLTLTHPTTRIEQNCPLLPNSTCSFKGARPVEPRAIRLYDGLSITG